MVAAVAAGGLMRTALISVALAVAGIGAIVAVASTAGPPEGYARFASEGAHVYRPTALRVVASGGRPVVLNVRGAQGAVRIVTLPAESHALGPSARAALAEAGGGRIASDEPADVTGADDAREVVADDAQQRTRRTAVIARQDDRVYVLTVSVRRGTPDSVLDSQTVVDSFYLD
jgi:hypothetical protein